MEIIGGASFKFVVPISRSPLKSAAFSLSSSSPSIGRRPFFTTTAAVSRRAFRDDDTSSSSSEVVMATADIDPCLAVKVKASEFSPVLKGTSVSRGDSLVQEAAGGDSSLINNDEDQFCEAETEVLKQLSSMGRLVSAGNGAVHNATNLYGISVWIDVPVEMVATEVMDQLPASAGSYSAVLAQVTGDYEKSKSGYAAADSIISLQGLASKLGYEDVGEVSVEDVALEVLGEVEKLTRVKKMIEEAARPV